MAYSAGLASDAVIHNEGYREIMGSLVISILAGLGLGYGLSRWMILRLPAKLARGNQRQRNELIREAKERAESARARELDHLQRKESLWLEEIAADIEESVVQLSEREKEIDSEIEEWESEVAKLEQQQQTLAPKIEKITLVKSKYSSLGAEISTVKVQTKADLAKKASADSHQLRKTMTDDFVSFAQLESAKLSRILQDDLENNLSRLSSRTLARLHARYTPNFIWPKGINHVDVTSEAFRDLLKSEKVEEFSQKLTEVSGGVQLKVEMYEDKREESWGVVRLGGGFGIYKEALKIALESTQSSVRDLDSLDKLFTSYSHNAKQLEALALNLGQIAIAELKIPPMHEEILKLVGALNWRTSYRQNQYFHSLEVSKLAGLLATELGVDPVKAKRCGLLHDIGKAIDYRIEGSHAVISGDYADRYGETKEICDTVMSHHADLIVDTPLAYILMSADTLSGARPGARVNLEEGYRDRLSSIQDVIRSFDGVQKIEIMNGAREVHILVDKDRVKEKDLQELSTQIARKIEQEVTFPGQIKILVTRRFEAVGIA